MIWSHPQREEYLQRTQAICAGLRINDPMTIKIARTLLHFFAENAEWYELQAIYGTIFEKASIHKAFERLIDPEDALMNANFTLKQLQTGDVMAVKRAKHRLHALAEGSTAHELHDLFSVILSGPDREVARMDRKEGIR